MTRSIRTATVTARRPQDENRPPRLPRRSRIGSAVASGLITAVLFGSVVIGMTSMADDSRTLAGDIPASTKA